MDKDKKKNLQKKIGYSVVLSASVLLLIFVFCGRYFKSAAFKSIANFFVGCFGMSFYGFAIAAIVGCSFALANKKIFVPKKYVVHFVLLFVEVVMLAHMFSTITLCNEVDTFSNYINYVYNYYDGFPTFGGVLFGTIVYGLQKGLTIYGASILLFAALAASVYLVGDFFYSYATNKLTLDQATAKRKNDNFEVPSDIAEQVEAEDEHSRAMRVLFGDGDLVNTQSYGNQDNFDTAPQSNLDDAPSAPQKSSKDKALDILFNGSPIDDSKDDGKKEEQEIASNLGFFNVPSNESEPLTRKQSGTTLQPIESEKPAKVQRNRSEAQEQAKTTTKTDNDGGVWIVPIEPEKTEDVPNNKSEAEPIDPVDIIANVDEHEVPKSDKSSEIVEQSSIFDTETTAPTEEIKTESEYMPSPLEPITYVENAEPEAVEQPQDIAKEDFAVAKGATLTESVAKQDAPTDTPTDVGEEPLPTPADENELIPIKTGKAVPGGIQEKYDFQSSKDVQEAVEKVHHYPKYVVPPFDLLEEAVAVEDTEQEHRESAAQQIVKKLSIFGIDIKSEGQIVGPSVTRFQFSVTSEKTRMSDFKQYSADIKACLEAENDIIIQAPIPGTNMVGVEVANKVTRTVKLRNLLQSKEFAESNAKLAFIIGQEITGKILVGDLSKLPHLLVAGTTGSGKSVFLDSMIISMMYKYGPEYLRFIMVDPKLVELSRFNGIPHMLTSETVTTQTEALASMDYLINEMEARYQLFKQNGVVNIVGYNAKINTAVTQRLPYLVLVVDELSDLMSVCQKQFEAKLLKLAQKSRAAGIHMVLATQRPDVKTITGTIKTNFSCRVALKVAAPQDSMTILSSGGAEKLLGRGDMLYLGEGQATPTRAQGTYVSDQELADFVEYVKSSNEVYFDESISKQIFSANQESEEPSSEKRGEQREEKLDPYCRKALRFWLERQNGRASIASIQRSLKIGFNRAGRIMDSLQQLGYVEEQPSNESTRPVQVLITLDDLDKIFPDMED